MANRDRRGTMEKRCAFTLELVQKLCSAIGPKRVGVRLAAYGLFNQVSSHSPQEAEV